jgi:hypothetical protein
MATTFDARIINPIAKHILADAKAHAEVPVRVARRAGNSARASTVRAIKTRFSQRRRRGGVLFANTVPKMPRQPEDMGQGQVGFRVRTKAFFSRRRSVGFDLFWFFDNAPRVVASGKGKWLAIPLGSPNTSESLIPSRRWGRAAAIAWPSDLKNRGWRLKVVPARNGRKAPLIIGIPPGGGTWKDAKPLYTLHKAVNVRKGFNLKQIHDRTSGKIDGWLDAEMRKTGKRIATRPRLAA